jgi:predicted O-linked N-acetylglucosamine transferase (SPINDLY family)
MRARVRKTFDRFITVAGKTDPEIAQLAREMGLHIAVDLKGFTLSNRLGVFSFRAAPIQMHYIGYPGTLGMPGVIDYQIADRVLVPVQARPFYTEKIIELPDSYQVNDRQRVIDPVVPSRAELGLPDDAFVFCCFNNNYKITRDVFGLWMQLLKEKEGSVLWLLADNDAAARNLKQAARDAGIDSDRLIFAQRADLPQHLARHAQADLFLDTLPYNAHTTASDALWAGLPVLTRMGETFASRVGASLLMACNLPELITRTPQEYLERARELAHDPQQLKAIRQKLQDTRLQVPLFDTERFTRHIERAYDLAWERFAQGLPPDHITVPQ